MQLTLVAHHGTKPPALAALITQVVQLIVEHCGADFVPYSLAQTHATLLGLETTLVDGVHVNRAYFELRDEPRVTDSRRLLSLLHETDLLPFDVRIGGYQQNVSYPFTSRNTHPHLRSFHFQGTKAVLMGWPDRGGVYTDSLVRLRKDLEEANALHRYHTTPEANDNDAYLVVGHLSQGVPARALQTIESEVRAWLSSNPTTFAIDRSALAVIAYRDPSLPEASSRRMPIDDDRIEAWLPAELDDSTDEDPR